MRAKKSFAVNQGLRDAIIFTLLAATGWFSVCIVKSSAFQGLLCVLAAAATLLALFSLLAVVDLFAFKSRVARVCAGGVAAIPAAIALVAGAVLLITAIIFLFGLAVALWPIALLVIAFALLARK